MQPVFTQYHIANKGKAEVVYLQNLYLVFKKIPPSCHQVEQD